MFNVNSPSSLFLLLYVAISMFALHLLVNEIITAEGIDTIIYRIKSCVRGRIFEFIIFEEIGKEKKKKEKKEINSCKLFTG